MSPLPPSPYGTKLEDLSAEGLWVEFAKKIPADVDPFLLERIQEAFLAGAYNVLMLELRLRREPPERGRLLMDRLRGEHDMLLMLLGNAGANGTLVAGGLRRQG